MGKDEGSIKAVKKILLAITFLTRLPFPIPKSISPDDMGRTTPFFPMVGLLIGLILVVINYALSYIWAPYIVNVLLIISLIVITGGLHLDGLMDTCDGIFSGKDRERTLEIMHDSRVGAMGVLGAICIIVLKMVFLSAANPGSKMAALIAFPMLGRFSMVFAVSAFPYARTSPGLGSLFVEYAKKRYIFWAIVQVLVVTIPLLLWKAFPVIVIVVAFTWLLGKWLTNRLEGLTGDTYGAICEITETMSLALISAIDNVSSM